MKNCVSCTKNIQNMCKKYTGTEIYLFLAIRHMNYKCILLFVKFPFFLLSNQFFYILILAYDLWFTKNIFLLFCIICHKGKEL